MLLFVQLLGILVYPYFDTSTPGEYRPYARALFGIFGLLVLFLAVRAARATPALTWVAIGLGLPVVVLTVLEAFYPDPTLIFVSSVLHALFYFYTAYGLIRYMFADNWVTRDELYATGATFTVVAWGFAYLYLAVQHLFPDSFIITTVKGVSALGDRSWFELLYLSIANMTGTGLSDVYAITPHARSFMLLQQIFGMLYVALVVARLVGLTIARFRNNG
ncbi:Ion channel [Humibacillus sp. DSM 29435]|nr:Ion channel [Humibacillus sp. DSM 29435]